MDNTAEKIMITELGLPDATLHSIQRYFFSDCFARASAIQKASFNKEERSRKAIVNKSMELSKQISVNSVLGLKEKDFREMKGFGIGGAKYLKECINKYSINCPEIDSFILSFTKRKDWQVN